MTIKVTMNHPAGVRNYGVYQATTIEDAKLQAIKRYGLSETPITLALLKTEIKNVD